MIFNAIKPKNISKGNKGRVIAKSGIDTFLNKLGINKTVKIYI